MRRRYGIAISAMILTIQFADVALASEPTLEQLQTISELLDSNNVQSLRLYLAQNPELLDGNSELAQLLEQYMQETDDIVGFLGVEPSAFDDGDEQGMFEALQESLSAAESAAASPVAPRAPDVSPQPDISLY